MVKYNISSNNNKIYRQPFVLVEVVKKIPIGLSIGLYNEGLVNLELGNRNGMKREDLFPTDLSRALPFFAKSDEGHLQRKKKAGFWKSFKELGC